MNTPTLRQTLSAPGLLRTARQHFLQIPDQPSCDLTLIDHLMSGLALFGLKYPSRLQFDEDRCAGATPANRKVLYGIEQPPAIPPLSRAPR